MREIKFRGYSEKMKIWCYGYYVEQSGYSYIVDFDTIIETTKDFRDVFEDLSWSLVEEKSVGQYTGLKDKNGKEIYEGDIVEGSTQDDYPRSVIGFEDGSFVIQQAPLAKWKVSHFELTIIGNIYEHGELLKNGQ